MPLSKIFERFKDKISSSPEEREEDENFPNLFGIDDFSPSERKCMEALRKVRWENGVKCPKCESDEVVKFGKSNKKHAKRFHHAN